MFITPVVNLVLFGEPAYSLLLTTKIPDVVNTSCNPCFFFEEASCWQLCISNANCLQLALKTQEKILQRKGKDLFKKEAGRCIFKISFCFESQLMENVWINL